MNVKSIISIGVLLLGLLNFVLSIFGVSPLEFSGEEVNTLITLVVSLVGAGGTAWYNLAATDPGQIGTELTRRIKEGEIDINEAAKMVVELVEQGKGLKE